MWTGFTSNSKYVILISAILFIVFLAGCDEDGPILQPLTSGGVAEAFDRDGQEYFFKLPEGFIPVDFKISHWMPSFGSRDAGPEPGFWRSFYMDRWEITKRGTEIETIKVTVNGVEKEVLTGERVVVLVVPGRYESWYSQAYEVEMFEDIRMIYEQDTHP